MPDAALTLADWGGQLLQADLPSGPLFYLSPLAAPAGAAVRGGVPVIFPQFAHFGPLAKHGFARNLRWQVMHVSPNEIEAALVLPAGSRADWPQAAELRVLARRAVGDVAGQAVFELTMTVRNIDTRAWSFTGGLHPYWRVSDLAQLRVAGVPATGLGGVEIDAWHAGGGEVVLTDTGGEAGREIRLTQSGFEGWQVWSPGPTHALTDLPHADWRRFLCIEPMMMTPYQLAPGAFWKGCLQVDVRHAAG